MTVAIHQPNYIPWLGYFYKMLRADLFIYHDAIPFSRSSYTRRCRIQTAKGSAEQDWLSVPVKHAPEGILIADIQIDNSKNWRSKHLNKISNTYSSAPFFEEVFPILKEALNGTANEENLSVLNTTLLQHICEQLMINVQIAHSSDYDVNKKGTALNLALALQVKASVYLSGTGALQYESAEDFEEHNIKIEVADIMSWLSINPYQQSSPRFMGGLSIVDALMNLGFGGTREVLDRMVGEIPAKS